ncbi:unnamed protein product [Brassica rapa]|uniref:NAC domain-containing protein n=1 Tax=Brassica campestris TaxID=3711 RepID=A0A8D9LW25_BRACM|nr:unnamed protein product [Brassica rapa]
MEEIRAAKYPDVKDDHSKATDEKMITEACGRTDGCGSGGWRIIGHDKLIKDEDTGKILGFKKILKFCGETKARGYKRTWVMQQYRVPSKWNPKQDHVVCKIQLLFQTEISFLLAKHFTYSADPLPATQSLTAYGIRLANQQDDGAYYLQVIFDSGGNEWPCYVTNDVYCVHPSTLVDHEDKRSTASGLCIFANRTEACGYTDGCESGRWRIVEEDNAIFSMSHEVMGYKRVFKFYEEDKGRYFDIVKGEEVLRTWIMEEYRLVEDAMKDKVLCVIKRGRSVSIRTVSVYSLIIGSTVLFHSRSAEFQPASSQRYCLIHSCLLNMIYCNDPDPNEVIKIKRGGSWERIITYSMLGVFR